MYLAYIYTFERQAIVASMKPFRGLKDRKMSDAFRNKNIRIMTAMPRRGAPFMYAWLNSPFGTAIVICKEECDKAGLTIEEIRCMLWHEYAHIVQNATEEEADGYAINKTSFEIWESAINKMNLFPSLHDLPVPYKHRAKYCNWCKRWR